eukprot:Tamp_22454.p2 GENE.Tamp_22454~~Tamp_22454.p2  ORF type:complete len:150 (-),score=32.59 Tamp_22454:75-524(-)
MPVTCPRACYMPTPDEHKRQAKRAAGGFFKEVLCVLSQGCVYSKIHHGKTKINGRAVQCICKNRPALARCPRADVGFEHGYVVKTKNPSAFFEMRSVWETPDLALEFGSMYLCCKNCNNAAEKVGASNMQMILYQDVVHARAALGVQAP